MAAQAALRINSAASAAMAKRVAAEGAVLLKNEAGPRGLPLRNLGAELGFFFQYLGACRRRTPTTCVDLKVPEDASHRDLSDAALRLDLSFGVDRRRAPKSCRK